MYVVGGFGGVPHLFDHQMFKENAFEFVAGVMLDPFLQASMR